MAQLDKDLMLLRITLDARKGIMGDDECVKLDFYLKAMADKNRKLSEPILGR